MYCIFANFTYLKLKETAGLLIYNKCCISMVCYIILPYAITKQGHIDVLCEARAQVSSGGGFDDGDYGVEYWSGDGSAVFA